MKKWIAFALAMLCASAALAESVDLSAFTDDDLVALKARIVAELEERHPVEQTVFHFKDGGPWMLVNTDGITVYLTGRRRLDMPFYHLETVFENNSGMELSVLADDFKLDGWNLSGGSICPSIKPGEKQASDLFYNIEEALHTSFDQMKTLTFMVETRASDYSVVHRYGPFSLLFNEDN